MDWGSCCPKPTQPKLVGTDTLDLIRSAREDLKTVMVEFYKVEYLLSANLPQLEYLQSDIDAYVRKLASGLAALAKYRLEANGINKEPEQ